MKPIRLQNPHSSLKLLSLKLLLQTLNISYNSISVIQANYILFKIKSTYHIILILNATTKLLFQEFVLVIQKLTHTYLLKGDQQPECIFCDCLLILHHIFLEFSDTLPARSLLLNNVQTVQDLFTQVNISDIWQFLQECDFYNKI